MAVHADPLAWELPASRRLRPHPFKHANIETRLKEMPARDQESPVNWGCAIADAGLRAHVEREVQSAPVYPYPGGVL